MPPTFNVSVLLIVELEGGVAGFGLKEAVTPAGSPVVFKVTGLLKVLREVIVHVEVPLDP